MIALLLLPGCINTIRFPPDLWNFETADTGRDTGSTTPTPVTPTEPTVATQLEQVGGGCDPTGDAWTWNFRANAWTLGGRMDVFRLADGAEEGHPLTLVAADPEGAWDELRVGPLPDGTPAPDQVSGVNSRFDCDADVASLTMVVRLRDLTDALSDCVVWGADPTTAVARIRADDPDVTALGGCRLLTP